MKKGENELFQIAELDTSNNFWDYSLDSGTLNPDVQYSDNRPIEDRDCNIYDNLCGLYDPLDLVNFYTPEMYNCIVLATRLGKKRYEKLYDRGKIKLDYRTVRKIMSEVEKEREYPNYQKLHSLL